MVLRPRLPKSVPVPGSFGLDGSAATVKLSVPTVPDGVRLFSTVPAATLVGVEKHALLITSPRLASKPPGRICGAPQLTALASEYPVMPKRLPPALLEML